LLPLLQMTETLEPHRLERARFLAVLELDVLKDPDRLPEQGLPQPVLQPGKRAYWSSALALSDGEHRQLLFVRRVSDRRACKRSR